MDDNSNKVRRCGQIGEGEDDEVSMEDVLEEQARLQADASAVLGASDPNNCTYPKGYLKRQALYACATCTPNGNASICLACSYACHEGHDLYELYTKRFFCCDCGNEKFSGKECKLVKDKQMNSRNRYNQNFKGLYCSCSRPYPDPDDSVEDEMIQCIICEDWHHGRHLKTTVPDDFCEMVCPECMSKFPFLWAYYVLGECDVIKKEEENLNESDHIDAEKTDCVSSEEYGGLREATASPLKEEKSISDKETTSMSDKEKYTSDDPCVTNKENDICEGTSKVVMGNPCSVKRGRDDSDEEQQIKSKVLRPDPSTLKSDIDTGVIAKEEDCLLQSLQKRNHEVMEHAAFWPQGWRSKLCKCHNCVDMYKDKNIDFLIEESDTVQAYEEAGTADGHQVSEEEAEENIFAGMHRVQQIEIARGVRDLKTELNEFLQGFARDGKVVTETDIREFFQSLEEKRRRRMNLPQNNCR